MEIKGAVYTKGNEDTLSNFKDTATDAQITNEQAWYVFAKKHWDAVTSYIKGDGPKDIETIDERVIDLINYLYILLALRKDKEKCE